MRSLLEYNTRSAFRSISLLALSLLIASAIALRADETRPKSVPAAILRRTPVVEVVEKTRASIVNIHSERTITMDARDKHLALMQTQQRVNGMGTGIIIDPRGYIITNHHVVDDVHLLRVKLNDGTSLNARIVAKDLAEDLAIIKVDPPKPLQTASIGTSTDLMEGETVVAIGNAFGYENTVTSGIISALKRDVNLNREISYKMLIQTDASINPGNSGGPLFNIHGELIGINVAIRAGAQGIGFAIPVDNMIRVAADLLSVRRRTGFSHGLVIRDAVDASDTPLRRWAMIERVDPMSPAAKCGLKAGDVLESVGDQKILCALDVERAFLDRPTGEKLSLVAKRGTTAKGEGGQDVGSDIVLKAGDKAMLPSEIVWKKLGVRVQPIPVDQVVKVNPQLHGGLLVTEVNESAAAGKAGFQRGDILIGLHQWETITLDNVTYVISHPEVATFAPIRYFRIRSGKLQEGHLPKLE